MKCVFRQSTQAQRGNKQERAEQQPEKRTDDDLPRRGRARAGKHLPEVPISRDDVGNAENTDHFL